MSTIVRIALVGMHIIDFRQSPATDAAMIVRPTFRFYSLGRGTHLLADVG
jgi:hypothetical protein